MEVCGQGASSLVIRGKCKRTGEEVAVKCVELDSLQLDLVRTLGRRMCVIAHTVLETDIGC